MNFNPLHILSNICKLSVKKLYEKYNITKDLRLLNKNPGKKFNSCVYKINMGKNYSIQILNYTNLIYDLQFIYYNYFIINKNNIKVIYLCINNKWFYIHEYFKIKNNLKILFHKNTQSCFSEKHIYNNKLISKIYYNNYRIYNKYINNIININMNINYKYFKNYIYIYIYNKPIIIKDNFNYIKNNKILLLI